MDTLYYLNGNYTSSENSVISVFDRGFLFGDALYEVIPIYKAQTVGLEAHINRLNDGLEYLGINLIQNPLDIILSLISNSNIQNGLVYLQISRGNTVPRFHVPLGNETPNFFAFIKNYSWPALSENVGMQLITDEDLRWKMCSIKTTNLLPNVLAKKKAKEQKADEAILVRKNGTISEGTSSSIFGISGSSLIFPPLKNDILPSITRKQIVTVAPECGLSVVTMDFTISDLVNFDGVFVAASDIPLNYASRINEYTFPEPKYYKVLISKFLEKAASGKFK